MKFPPLSSITGGNLIDFHFEGVNFDFSQAPKICQWITETVAQAIALRASAQSVIVAG